ncbi:MAG: Uma2 family endonuclease [Chloroflexi bacterium]|nr:Uma2 family endonuclease [Chloroflexota bacterium]
MITREQFYRTVKENDKAQFVNGKIVYHPPAQLRENLASRRLVMLLCSYVSQHDLGFVGYEKLSISLTQNDYEPDLCFFEKARAQKFSAQQTRFPAPDFVVEVLSDSTAEIDRGVKFEDYAAHGVAEYWLVDPELEIIEQYELDEDHFELLLKVNSGILASMAVEGFAIPVRAVFDEAENRRALQAIVGNT